MKNVTVMVEGVPHEVELQNTTMVKDMLAQLRLEGYRFSRNQNGTPLLGDVDVLYNDVKDGDEFYAIPQPGHRVKPDGPVMPKAGNMQTNVDTGRDPSQGRP